MKNKKSAHPRRFPFFILPFDYFEIFEFFALRRNGGNGARQAMHRLRGGVKDVPVADEHLVFLSLSLSSLTSVRSLAQQFEKHVLCGSPIL